LGKRNANSPAAYASIQTKSHPATASAGHATALQSPRAGASVTVAAARQSRHINRPSCSVTHSRQKNLAHSGQRATASRSA